jgi:uncharacterized protein YodC (DUF2158 family)
MSDDPVLFKVGDVVRLKSGGHLMTVASIDEGSVACDWSVRGDIKSKSFPPAELEEADPPISLEQMVLRAHELVEGSNDRCAKSR